MVVDNRLVVGRLEVAQPVLTGFWLIPTQERRAERRHGARGGVDKVFPEVVGQLLPKDVDRVVEPHHAVEADPGSHSTRNTSRLQEALEHGLLPGRREEPPIPNFHPVLGQRREPGKSLDSLSFPASGTGQQRHVGVIVLVNHKRQSGWPLAVLPAWATPTAPSGTIAAPPGPRLRAAEGMRRIGSYPSFYR